MSNRREFLKTAGSLSTVALAGLSGCTGGGGNEDAVTFVLSPAESDVDVEKQYKPLFSYLEEETGATIESNVAADYAAVLQALKSGQADLADAAPAVAIQAGKEDAAEVAGIRVAYGAAKYFSLITTLPDSGISKLTDLKGEQIAFADPLSTSGSLFPLYMLSKAGLDIGNAPEGEATDFKGNWSDHSTARETLRNRDPIKAAGTGAFAVSDHVPKDQFPKRFQDISAEWEDAGSKTGEYALDLLATSDPIPRAPILVRSDWEDPVRKKMVDALLNAEKSDLQKEDAEEKLWFTGVVEGSVDDYEPVKKVIEELGIELGQS